jgi:hypothetical protein
MGVVRLSAGTRASLTEEFRSFPHSLPPDFRIVPDYAHRPLYILTYMVHQSSHYRRYVLRVAEGVGRYNQDWPKVSKEHSDAFLYSSFSVHGTNHFYEPRSSHSNKCAVSARVGGVVF